MLGAIIGDIVGSPYEFTFRNIKTKDFPLFCERSKFTDDTVMTVAVGLGIIKGYGRPELTRSALINNMCAFGSQYPFVGYGQKFFIWLFSKNHKPFNSYGNGAAMQVSSVAWAYNSIEEVEKYAKISAEISHNHPEGIKGAQATASAIFLARYGATKEDIRSHINGHFGYDLSRTPEEIRPNYYHIETCQESVPEAICAFLASTSYEDAIRTAVSLGGDSDTIAAIAGSIAEAFYGGIPDDIKCAAMNILREKDEKGLLLSGITEWQEWQKKILSPMSENF